MKYILAMLMSFLLVCRLIPILMKLSIKYNFTDKPTKRKIHRGEIPFMWWNSYVHRIFHIILLCF